MDGPFFGGLNGDDFGPDWGEDWGEDGSGFTASADPLHFHSSILYWIKSPIVEMATDKALLVGGRDGSKEISFWVPKSLIRGWNIGQPLDKAFVWQGFKPKLIEQIDVTKEFERLV